MATPVGSKEGSIKGLGPLGFITSSNNGQKTTQGLFSSFTDMLDQLSFRSTSDSSSEPSITNQRSGSSNGGFWDTLMGIGAGIVQATSDFVTSISDAFFSQFQGPTNQFAHGNNANCGPVALAMIAELFGVLDINSQNAHDMTHYIRSLMGNTNEFEATTGRQLEAGARQLGLDAQAFQGSPNDLISEIRNGKAVIANVDSTKYGGQFEKHWATVVSVDERAGTATILDPQFGGPRTVSFSQLKNAMGAVGNYMVAIGSGSGGNNIPPSTHDDQNHNKDEHTFGSVDFRDYDTTEEWFDYFGL